MVKRGEISKRARHPSASREVKDTVQHALPRDRINKLTEKPEPSVIVTGDILTPPSQERQMSTVDRTITTAAAAPSVVDLNDETLTESLRAASRKLSSEARPASLDSDAKREPRSRSDSLNLGFERRQSHYMANSIIIPTPYYAHGYDVYGLPLAMTQEQTYAFQRDSLSPKAAVATGLHHSSYANHIPSLHPTAYGPSHPSLPRPLGYPLTASPPPGRFNASTQTSLPSIKRTTYESQSAPVADGPEPSPKKEPHPPSILSGLLRPFSQSGVELDLKYKTEASLQQITEISAHQSAADTITESTKAIYGKLAPSEFRLVRIRPLCSGPLKLSLFPAPIHRPPHYRALSYAWGDSKDFVEVEVNGVPFKITSNLFEALQALQSKDRDVLCWADALAINQKDKKEVTVQVQMMKKIYSTASSVAIWLGAKSGDSDMALDLIKSLSDNTIARNDGSLRRLIKSRDQQLAFKALVSLFERDYWRRLWVVQEVINARHVTVHCGSSSMPWRTYQQAAEVLQNLSASIDQTYSSWLCDGAEPLYISPKSRMSYSEVFLQLGPASFRDVESLHEPDASSDAASSALKLQKALCMCRSKFATDARDKVYGLLGVLPDDVQKHIVPDYDVSIKDVFTKAAEYIISNTKRLDVLGSAFHFPVHISPLGLPSWVPDWSHISPMTPVDWPAGRFSASASTKSKADLDSNNHRILSTWAIEIDRVVQTGIPISTVNTVDNFIMSFMHWYAMLQKDLRDSDEAQKVRAEDAFCRTLALDHVHPLFQAPGKWRQVTFHLFASLCEERLPEMPLHSRLAEFTKPGCADLHDVSRNSIIQEIFSPGMTGRSFFFTKSGIMGMGSGYLSTGDMAVVPLGCCTPLLLRKDVDTNEFKFVSDAYLDGYMYGKAIDDWISGLMEPDRFNIH